jgi:hypothetical protein
MNEDLVNKLLMEEDAATDAAIDKLYEDYENDLRISELPSWMHPIN